jgi:hypothetical protein
VAKENAGACTISMHDKIKKNRMRPVRRGEILNQGFLAGTFFKTLAKVWVLCK